MRADLKVRLLAFLIVFGAVTGTAPRATSAPTVSQDRQATKEISSDASPESSEAAKARASGKTPTSSSEAPALATEIVGAIEPPPLDASFKPGPELAKFCENQLKQVPHAETVKRIPEICAKTLQLSACTSVKKDPIYHFDKEGDATQNKPIQNILVFGLVHGDEEQSASVALSWMNRLMEIQPRNRWRIVPVLNPDGWKTKTRTNANGVDVNRNFPSKDWDELAQKYWKSKAQASERRFPGHKAGSEPETLCAMQHIADFKPDFVISIHTPLGVLDFDGPKVEMPKFQPLPWVSLGNFPGSLGRYMWVDRDVPVLTVELKSQKLAAKHLEEFDKLQDITGTVALQAEKAKKKKAQNQSSSVQPADGAKSVSKNP